MSAAVSEPSAVEIVGQHGPWTIADVMALPEDGFRHEIVDGVLIVNPPPTSGHQQASYVLHRVLHDAARAAGAAVRVRDGMGIELPSGESPECMLIPDLLVVDAVAVHPTAKLFQARDVVLAVEVVSPGSRARDRTEKPYLYAEAGIPWYWRVELNNYRGRVHQLPVVHVHELTGLGEYQEVRQFGAGAVAAVAEPFPVSFDPAVLVIDD